MIIGYNTSIAIAKILQPQGEREGAIYGKWINGIIPYQTMLLKT